MAAQTRSQIRKLVEHIKSSPYASGLLARTKGKLPSVSKLDALLEREKTPHEDELFDTAIAMVYEAMDKAECLTDEKSKFHGLQDPGAR